MSHLMQWNRKNKCDTNILCLEENIGEYGGEERGEKAKHSINKVGSG